MRATNFTEVCLVGFIIAAAAFLNNKSTDRKLLNNITVGVAGSLLATSMADFVVLGPWSRLLMTYLFAWDALRYMFSDVNIQHRVSTTYSGLEKQCNIKDSTDKILGPHKGGASIEPAFVAESWPAGLCYHLDYHLDSLWLPSRQWLTISCYPACVSHCLCSCYPTAAQHRGDF